MSTIAPGELLNVAGAGDPETIVQSNLEIASRRIFQFLPTYESGVATVIKGPPTADAHILNEFWRDALGAEYVCTVAGTPGTWKQIKPAPCSSAPTGIPTGYWIVRTDLLFVHYRYDGAAWKEVRFAMLKLNATAAPAVTDDSAAGYAIGSRWIDTTNDKEYVCTDATAGAALWKETTNVAGTGEANTASNVGAGAGLFKQKTAVDLEFKSLTAGAGINVAASGVSEVQVKTTFAATDKVLGRSTAGAGDGEEIACTAAGRALLDDASAAAQRTTLGLGTAATMAGPSGAIVGTSDAQTLTNKTIAAGSNTPTGFHLQGKQTIWVPAPAMVARTTNGAAAGTVQSPTNKVMQKTLDFDQSTAEYAQFAVAMPKSWDLSTVTAQFVWLCSVTGNVVWGLQAVAISDDDLIDAAFGTAQTVTDGVTATTDKMTSAETAAITAAGTPAALDTVFFQVYRDAAAGGDTAAGDAKLLGVRLYYSTNASTDT